MAVQTLIQVRRGTASGWTSVNSPNGPVLSAGEWGYETDTGKVKIGDGTTAWASLDYLAIAGGDTFTQSEIEELARDAVGTALTEGDNISIDVDDASDTITIAVSGLDHADISDFDNAVTDIIATGAISAEEVMDIVGTGLVSGSNISITYDDSSGNDITIAVDTLTHDDISDFDNAVTEIISTGTSTTATNVTATANNSTDETVYVTFVDGPTGDQGIETDTGLTYNPSTNTLTATTFDGAIANSNVTDLQERIEDVVDGLLVDGDNIEITYDDVGGTLTIDVTGLSSGTHQHVLADGATDVTATATEVNYLDGTTLGTVTASNVVAVDANKDITGFRNFTTAGNVTVGGNLNVAGTTTTVNSTTVEIGDNIIRVNTSGLTEGGIEVQDGTTGNYKKFVWDNSDSRFEADGSIEADGFIGDLTGNADTVTDGVYTTDNGTVTSTMIANGTILNVDINASADIAVSKLAAGSNGQVLQTNSSGNVVFGSIDGGSP